jgi:transposase
MGAKKSAEAIEAWRLYQSGYKAAHAAAIAGVDVSTVYKMMRDAKKVGIIPIAKAEESAQDSSVVNATGDSK